MRRFFLHPSDRALAEFVEPADTTSPSVRAHLARCQRCRSTIAFHREVQAAARSLPLAHPPLAMLDRVLAERARGDRFILPAGDMRMPARSMGRRLVAAAVLIVVAGSAATLIERSRRTATTRPTGVDVVSAEMFGSALSLIRAAEAQELPARSEPGAPPITRVSGRRLHRGRIEFAQRWTDSTGRQTIDSRGTMEVTPSTLGALDVWRVVSVWSGNIGAYGERMEVESLLVAREDLRPLTRSVHASPYSRYSRINIAQLFRGDSVLGVMTAERRDSIAVRRLIAQKLPVAFGPFISEAMSPVMLTAVDLTMGWRHSLSLLGWAVHPSDLYSPVELRVVGAERIMVPAGSFDCWRLSLETGTHHITYWVRKSDGLGILSRDESKRAGKGVREMVLVRE